MTGLPAALAGAAGRLVCVVGPSGAGKDTLIGLAREALCGDPRFVFVRRLITRPPGAAEDNEPVSESGFAAGVRDGAFLLHWRAHGLGYAVPAAAADAIALGRIAVCNLSRAVAPEARRRFRAAIVLVTAPAETRSARIAARGREVGAEVGARLAREDFFVDGVEADLTIDNSGPPDAGAARLVGFLRSLPAGEKTA